MKKRKICRQAGAEDEQASVQCYGVLRVCALAVIFRGAVAPSTPAKAPDSQ